MGFQPTKTDEIISGSLKITVNQRLSVLWWACVAHPTAHYSLFFRQPEIPFFSQMFYNYPFY
ncbi:MAG: hypothetical protein IJV35_10840 [Neisseriaceae bacterium]|nr:hypothetical protein [Neisseriaceae bacterium]